MLKSLVVLMYYSWPMYYLTLVCLFIINLGFITDNDVVILLMRRVEKAAPWPFVDTSSSSGTLHSSCGAFFIPFYGWETLRPEKKGLVQSVFLPLRCLQRKVIGLGNLGSTFWADHRVEGRNSCRILMPGLSIMSPPGPSRSSACPSACSALCMLPKLT